MRIQTFAQDTAAPASGGNLLSNLLSPLLTQAEGQVTSNLPTKQQAVEGYVAAVLVFWLVGGLAIYLATSKH